MSGITREEFTQYYPQFLQHMHIEAVIHGNITQEVCLVTPIHCEDMHTNQQIGGYRDDAPHRKDTSSTADDAVATGQHALCPAAQKW